MHVWLNENVQDQVIRPCVLLAIRQDDNREMPSVLDAWRAFGMHPMPPLLIRAIAEVNADARGVETAEGTADAHGASLGSTVGCSIAYCSRSHRS